MFDGGLRHLGRDGEVGRVHCVEPSWRVKGEDHPEEACAGQVASDVGRGVLRRLSDEDFEVVGEDMQVTKLRAQLAGEAYFQKIKTEPTSPAESATPKSSMASSSATATLCASGVRRRRWR